MPKRVALAEFRTNIRGLSEFREEYTSDTLLNIWINQSINDFYSLVSSIDPLRYMKTQYIPILNGVSIYDLNDDFFKLSGVSIDNELQDGYYALESFTWNERHNVSGFTFNRNSVRYLIRGSTEDNTRDGYYTIQLSPTPNDSATLEVDYIPSVQTLDSDNDTIDTINGVGYNWICYDVAIKCAAREEQDTTPWEKLKETSERLLLNIAKQDITDSVPSKSSNSLLALIRAVRGRGPWKRDDITDTELVEYINSSIMALRDIIITKDPSYFLSTAYITATQGTESYSLPTDFYKVIGVSVLDTDGYSVIGRYNFDQRFDRVNIVRQDFTMYEIRGNQISFYPLGEWSGKARIEYIPKLTPLTSTSDTFEIGSGYWLEWVILHAAIKCAASIGSDPSILMTQLADTERRLISAMEVDMGEPECAVDYYRNRHWWF